MKCLFCKIVTKIQKRIYDFFHPSTESLMNQFAIIEKPITQKEYEICIKILKEWEV